jgi:hypothetical protein
MAGRTLAVFTGVELKAPGEKPSEEQMRFLRELAEAGGVSGWASSLEDALEIFQAPPA